MSIFSTRLVPAVAAAAVLAGLAASPASAARAHRHHAQAMDRAIMATAPMPQELYGTPDSNCYPTRIQVPTVGGGLQWENEMTCAYPDN